MVPFDAKKRGPEERAEMLQRLGFKNFAYDWRPNDVPTFDTEVESLKKHGVNLVAWWFPTDAGDPSARTIAGSAYKAEELSKQGIVLVFAGLLDGGADRNRTCDLLIANETLCQLSYDPIQPA